MYIAIRRLSANQECADYNFGEAELRMGRLRLDLKTGTATLLEACPVQKAPAGPPEMQPLSGNIC